MTQYSFGASASFKRFRLTLAIGTAAIAVTSAPNVMAQNQPDQNQPVTASRGDDGVIVVTARRREENLLDVPIAITAYSGDQLARTGVLDITDISDTTPNVTLENSRATNSTLTAFIRGVGQQDPVGGFEAGVGIYLDDVYLNRPQAAVLDVYEVERIEVLRGPQGTLYGRNTIGGAVKYVTKQLSDEFEVKLRATYGEYDQAEGVVTISAPISDLVRVGGTVARLSRGGFGENLNNGLDNYNKDIWAGRASLEIGGRGEPVFIRISGDYTKDESNPRNGHRLIPGLLSGAPVLDDVFDTRAGLNNPIQDIEAYGLAINASAEISDTLTLRSISAWRQDTSFAPIDFDSLPAADVDVPGFYANEQVSQEFQIVYEGERLRGLVGAYYLNADAITNFDVILGNTGALLNLPGLNAYTSGDVNTETWSVFGDFTFDITDQLAISAGGRYNYDKRTSRILRETRLFGTSPEFGGNAITIATTSDFQGENTFREFTPRASISFKPTDDHLLYASYSRGFKGGGFDPRGQSSAAPDLNGDGVINRDDVFEFLSFEPETVDSYELGYKGSLADGRVRLALTGFYADYTDVQVPGSVGIDANGDGINETFIGITSNAGKAEFKGFEAEVFAALAPDFAGAGSALNFNGTLGYIDGEYKQFIDAFGVDVADQRVIQNTPEWTLSGTLAAVIPMSNGVVNGSTTVSYRSETNQFEVPNAALDQPGYALWDASIVWTADSELFSLGIHGQNLTNKRYITSGYNFIGPNGAPTLGREGVLSAFFGNPRQVFATATFKY